MGKSYPLALKSSKAPFQPGRWGSIHRGFRWYPKNRSTSNRAYPWDGGGWWLKNDVGSEICCYCFLVVGTWNYMFLDVFGICTNFIKFHVRLPVAKAPWKHTKLIVFPWPERGHTSTDRSDGHWWWHPPPHNPTRSATLGAAYLTYKLSRVFTCV